MLSLLGVLLAILTLILLIYKRLQLIPASLLCVLILACTSGVSFPEMVMDHYAVSLAGFIAKYFMVFVTNALFGKVMEETLLVSALSRMIGRAFGDRNAAYGALLVTVLLSYGGVSAFVIVFTVYPIFLATFQKADLPRKYIPACIMSATCTFPLSMLPMVLIILLINLFHMDLSYAVLAGTALAMVIGWKNLPNKLRTINDGVLKVGPAMVTTAASVGFGGAVLACSGAQIILNAIATGGFSCLPHNGMLITVTDTCGFSARECYSCIFISTVLASAVGLVIAVVLGCLFYPILP